MAYGVPVFVNATAEDNHYGCNALANADVQVAALREAYLHTNSGGACTGVLDELYVPPGPLLDSAMAPLQPPFVVQSILEASVASKMDALPVFLPEACKVAFKRLVCGVAMMAAEGTPALAGILPDVYVPQYPHRDICEAYATDCASFIYMAAAQGTDVSQNCSAVTSSGALQFPDAAQTLMALPVPGVGFVPLTSEPNTQPMADAERMSGVETVCPHGFAVPDHPEWGRATMVPGSGCAVECPACQHRQQLS